MTKFASILSMSVGAFALPPPVPSAGVIEREFEKEYEGQSLEPVKEYPAICIEIPRQRLLLPAGKKIWVIV